MKDIRGRPTELFPPGYRFDEGNAEANIWVRCISIRARRIRMREEVPSILSSLEFNIVPGDVI